MPNHKVQYFLGYIPEILNPFVFLLSYSHSSAAKKARGNMYFPRLSDPLFLLVLFLARKKKKIFSNVMAHEAFYSSVWLDAKKKISDAYYKPQSDSLFTLFITRICKDCYLDFTCSFCFLAVLNGYNFTSLRINAHPFLEFFVSTL